MKEEDKHMNELKANTNSHTAPRAQKQYQEDNKEKIQEQYSTKVKCLCGSSICAGNKAKHERTNKHQDYLKSIQQ